ncbi:MAG: transcriptional regulator [Caldiserica bacterium]|nr:MAG: transcriptional regulator [Caldisericota bacterium]
MREEIRIFKALCNEVRLEIVKALLDGEKYVSEIIPYAGRMQPAVSMQLAKLEYLGIVESRREGGRVYYRIANEKIKRILRRILKVINDEK